MIGIKLTGGPRRESADTQLLLSLGLAIAGLVLGWSSRPRNAMEGALRRSATIVSLLDLLGAIAWAWYLVAVLPEKAGAVI